MYVKLSFMMMTKKTVQFLQRTEKQTGRRQNRGMLTEGMRAVTEKEHTSLDCRGKVWAVLERFTRCDIVSGGLSYPFSSAARVLLPVIRWKTNTLVMVSSCRCRVHAEGGSVELRITSCSCSHYKPL